VRTMETKAKPWVWSTARTTTRRAKNRERIMMVLQKIWDVENEEGALFMNFLEGVWWALWTREGSFYELLRWGLKGSVLTGELASRLEELQDWNVWEE
jgi:hypothetical protein